LFEHKIIQTNSLLEFFTNKCNNIVAVKYLNNGIQKGIFDQKAYLLLLYKNKQNWNFHKRNSK